MKKSSTALLMSLILTSASFSADDWTQQFPPSSPSAREDHAMAYIGGDQVLLFGGYDDETWIYDLSANAWTQKSPVSSPSSRHYHAMAYIGGDRAILFGGNDGAFDDETWIYDLSDDYWTQKYPSSSPSARDFHAMAYIGGDQVVLFGGQDGSGLDDETWIYDANDNTWTQQFPFFSPSPRRRTAMAYIGGDQVALFGGYEGSPYDNETWLYDLSAGTWTLKTPSESPPSREYHAMAYIGGDQVMLFGGFVAVGVIVNETWVYDLSNDNWTQDVDTIQPYKRWGHKIAETSFENLSYPVMFGGFDGWVPNNETWIFGEGDYLILGPPSIDTISDVPYDQGRQVAILWQRSLLDSPVWEKITHYTIWRLYPYGNMITTLYPEWDRKSPYNPDQPVYRILPGEKGGDQRDYWQLVGTVNAHFFDEYAYFAPTVEDSSSSGIPYFTFLVSAHTTDPFVFYDSEPDSGYSVDNVNPAPTQLQVQLAGETSILSLHWTQVTMGVNGSPELGAISYRIHSDTYPYFIPGPGNLLTTTSSLFYDHTDSGVGDPTIDLYYVIIATDAGDNESVPSNRVGEIDFLLP